jgi:ferredoxin--NADP+ reductase
MSAILSREALGPGLVRLVVDAPDVARAARAGQFVIVRADEEGERVPLTIVEAAVEEGTITLIVQAVGKSTRVIAALGPGESLRDVVGPLGNPSPIVREGPVACVGGWVGVAELLPIARALHRAGSRIDTIVGARTRDLVILLPELEAISETLTVTTEDGSLGVPGRVTGPLRERLLAGERWDALYAVGPLPMMEAVADATRPFGVRTLVSVNALMVDGTGMCGGCRLTVGGQVRFACVDGPDFDGHAVDFAELMRRNRTYRHQERQADEAFQGRSCAVRGGRA